MVELIDIAEVNHLAALISNHMATTSTVCMETVDFGNSLVWYSVRTSA